MKNECSEVLRHVHLYVDFYSIRIIPGEINIVM